MTAFPHTGAGSGLPGLADIHVHFLPPAVLAKVWAYFDAAEANYGMAWPVHYRGSEPDRLETVRRLGLRAIPSLTYAHRPDMARWLNEWCTEFAARVPDAVHSGTFFPEPSAAHDVRDALTAGARLFKVHVQVGVFSPVDPLLDEAWGVLAEARVPIVIHAGSAPRPGEHTGPGPVAELLRRHPDLVLVVAHLGMSEYHAFADLAEAYDGVHLDTTMAGTDFTEQFAPMPDGYVPRLAGPAGEGRARQRLPEHPVCLRAPAGGPRPAGARRRLDASGAVGERCSPPPDRRRTHRMRNGSPLTCAAESASHRSATTKATSVPTANADRHRLRVITAKRIIATGAAWKTSRNGAYQNTRP